jgi:hypothetical protein
MSTDLMIDIETLGTANNAHVLSIGMVWFDMNHPDEDLIELPLINVDMNQPQSCIDGSTVQWWMKQGPEARQVFADTVVRTPLSTTACAVMDQTELAERIWAKDPDFDCVILANFVSNYLSRSIKWPFWKNRSVRTILDNAPAARSVRFEGVQHNALADAVHQAKQMQAAFQSLRRGI